jgi:hypothetical protein
VNNRATSAISMGRSTIGRELTSEITWWTPSSLPVTGLGDHRVHPFQCPLGG